MAQSMSIRQVTRELDVSRGVIERALLDPIQVSGNAVLRPLRNGIGKYWATLTRALLRDILALPLACH